jgi:hypothetical protein
VKSKCRRSHPEVCLGEPYHASSFISYNFVVSPDEMYTSVYQFNPSLSNAPTCIQGSTQLLPPHPLLLGKRFRKRRMLPDLGPVEERNEGNDRQDGSQATKQRRSPPWGQIVV